MSTLPQRFISKTLLPFILMSPMAVYLMRARIAPKPEETVMPERKEISFVLSEADEPWDLHTYMQNKFIPKIMEDDVSRMDGKSERSKPSPVELSWEIECDEEITLDGYTVRLSMNDDMSDSREYAVDEEKARIYNLYLGETYYWTVSAEYEGLTYTSEVSSFSTLVDLPRNMNVGGVTNVRDMGGWSTLDGGKIRQGLIYRTGRLHTDDGADITEEGIRTMLDEMGIKTEIDLRNEIGITEYGPLGEGVRFTVLPMGYTDDIFILEAEKIRSFFGILADRDNYPVIFHCYIGTDRTGACAFLLNALLGVSEEDLIKDYMFSNFAYIGGSRTSGTIIRYLTFLEDYEGETLADRTASYLLSIGVTAEEIASVTDIMKIPA